MGILEGAAAVLIGFLLGRLTARRHRAREKGPVCHCRHALSFHDKKGCHHPVGMMREECSCKQYTGPKSLDEYYAPEIG